MKTFLWWIGLPLRFFVAVIALVLTLLMQPERPEEAIDEFKSLIKGHP